MKKFAFALIEQLIVIIIIAVLAVIMINTIKPNDVKTEALQKVARNTFTQIEFASKSILAKYTVGYNLTRMKDASGQFSIASADSLSRLVALYKKTLIGSRKTINATYGAKTLTNGSTSLSGLTPASFTGFIIKNGAYFGVKLHGNCTTTIDYIYDPSTPQNRTLTNTCGLIFFDLNEKEEPNILGIDQYIIGLGKFGVK